MCGVKMAFLFLHFIHTGRLSFNLSRYITQPQVSNITDLCTVMAPTARNADSCYFYEIVVNGILILKFICSNVPVDKEFYLQKTKF